MVLRRFGQFSTMTDPRLLHARDLLFLQELLDAPPAAASSSGGICSRRKASAGEVLTEAGSVFLGGDELCLLYLPTGTRATRKPTQLFRFDGGTA
jgi:hypothetical protein